MKLKILSTVESAKSLLKTFLEIAELAERDLGSDKSKSAVVNTTHHVYVTVGKYLKTLKS